MQTDIAYQPLTNWSVKVRDKFISHLENMRRTAMDTSSHKVSQRLLLSNSLLFCVAHDPQDGKLRAYGLTGFNKSKNGNPALPTADVALIRLAELPHSGADLLRSHVVPIVKEVYRKGLLPEVPSTSEVIELQNPALGNTLNEIKGTGVVLGSGFGLLAIGHLIGNQSIIHGVEKAVEAMGGSGTTAVGIGLSAILLRNLHTMHKTRVAANKEPDIMFYSGAELEMV